jgi:UDPglucose 6-dehydrogenase
VGGVSSLRLSVIGTSYLGATHAVCMASLGYDVVGVDIDPDKVARLSAGELPFYEPGLEDLLRTTLATGRLRFTADYAEIADADVHFVCVGTPQETGEYAADMSYVNAAFATLAPLLTEPCVVVGKSTVPVGTAERLLAALTSTAPAGDGVELVWNPEFLREGFAIEDTLRPDRLVFGVTSGNSERVMREVFAPVIATGSPVVITDLATAQLVKVAANAFLATKISFINAMAEVCEATGADVTLLSRALSHDSRIGGRFLNAGLGFGGGCLPKDIRAFMARAGELGVDQALSFLTEVDATFAYHRVAVLGAAFKPDSDDIRDSPALDVATRISKAGGTVTVYDPIALDNARRDYPDLNYAETAIDAARDADIVLHLTEWQEFRDLDPAVLDGVVAHKNIVDGRNVLDPARWRGAGWHYRALGRP